MPAGLQTQLIVYKVYKTPVVAPNGCDLRVETRNLLMVNLPNPTLIPPGGGAPDQNDPGESNATIWLAPGESGRVTLRVFDDDTSNNLIITNPDGTTGSIDPAFNPGTAVQAGISAQGVDILDPPGSTEPPVIVPPPPSDPVAATVTFTDLAAIFDGTPKPVTATTNPSGLAVSVTYNGSATPPSQIGAYLVEATVTQPGSTGFASAPSTIASTLSVGGPGGLPYSAQCESGGTATSIWPYDNPFYGLLGAELRCKAGAQPPAFSGPLPSGQLGYSTNDASCDVGQVMVGVHGRTGSPFGYTVLQSIGPRCQPTGGGAITDIGPAGGGTSPVNPFSLTCPAGQAVTGVVGGVGEVVDSIALVCNPVVAIASATPAAIGAGQMIVLRGANMPATAASGILFNQSGVDQAASYVFTADSSLVIARSPNGLVPGAATVRSAAGPTSTPAFPITISTTPGAPLLTAIKLQAGCAGPDVTTIEGPTPGQQVLVTADGVDTSNTFFVWTEVGGSGITTVAPGDYTTSGPGSVCTASTIPTAIAGGTWTLQLYVRVNGVDSPVSNAITVAFVN